MIYFALSTKPLKEKKSKIALSYLHQKSLFEIWFATCNREIASKYQNLFGTESFSNLNIFHDKINYDVIIECSLTPAVDFGN